MYFRAYVGKSYTDHDTIEAARAVPGATVVAIHGGVMVPTTNIQVPDLSPFIIGVVRSGIIIVGLVCVGVPLYVAYFLWHLAN